MRQMRRRMVLVMAVCAVGLSLSTGVAGASSTRTLGVAHAHVSGFGTVRPSVVSYGGDGQSLVAKVHWSSWGGARAVGHGKASWVWPGWCSACGSVTLKAKVVAFGRTTCNGQPIYRFVEWYFPSRGMRFSRGLAYFDLCKWTGLVPGVYVPIKCKPVNLAATAGSPKGVAEKIRIYAGRVSCAGVRRFLRASHVMRHYGHNTRMHHHRWWCGSELSMQRHKLPPQDFSCVRGDYGSIGFKIRKR